MAVPAPLRELVGKKEILYSLHTRDPAKARRLSYTLTSQTLAQFEKMAYDPKSFNPFDSSTFPTTANTGALRPYEIEVGGVRIKSDSVEDHRRALETLAAMSAIGLTKAAPVAPAQIPQQQLDPQPELVISISKALEAWSATNTDKKTRLGYASKVNRFIRFNGDVDVHKIQGGDVTLWKADLLKILKAVTVDTYIQALQSLLNWCFDHNYLSDLKPLATKGKFALTKGEREDSSEGAEPFSVEELNKIFDKDAYTSFITKNRGKKCAKRSEARYWFPVIGLFTGMRLEEIAQLTKNDIPTIEGIDCFHINRNGDKKVKTKASIRGIPIHSTLIRLGFLEYVKKVQGPSLWPELKKNVNGFGNPVSKAFIRHLEEVGVRKDDQDRSKVFHSFRDTFNNGLEAISDITPEVRYSLMGHQQNGTNEKNYLLPKTIYRLKREGIDLLAYKQTIAGITYTLNMGVDGIKPKSSS